MLHLIEKQHFHVYDAVVHPKVIDRADKNTAFKTSLIDLLFECVKETFNIEIDKTGMLGSV